MAELENMNVQTTEETELENNLAEVAEQFDSEDIGMEADKNSKGSLVGKAVLVLAGGAAIAVGTKVYKHFQPKIEEAREDRRELKEFKKALKEKRKAAKAEDLPIEVETDVDENVEVENETKATSKKK